jgi:serine-aspartate repeat-containing protein C/D/E
VFEDRDADGVQDAGEQGVAGVSVQLLDATGAVVATTTTDASGNYGFDIPAGDYTVQVSPPEGWTLSPIDAGSDDATDSDIGADGRSAVVQLEAGETDPSIDAGLYRSASLGDRVWVDSDRDGKQDACERGLANVTVKLLDSSGQVVATQTTDDRATTSSTG